VKKLSRHTLFKILGTPLPTGHGDELGVALKFIPKFNYAGPEHVRYQGSPYLKTLIGK
jgi:hypothetical protein